MLSEDDKDKAKEILNLFESLKYLNENLDLKLHIDSDNELVFPVGYPGTIAEVETEVNWSKNHEHTDIYHDFCGQMAFITFSESGLKGSNEVHLKMCFSYAVTLMESCLCEMLKSVTMRYEKFRRNAMENVQELSSAKIKLSLLFDRDPKELIDNEIIRNLSNILYHDLMKVKRVYKAILEKDITTIENDAYKNASELMKVRHDIVHRNGKKATGEVIDITRDMVDSCIHNIMKFVEGVHNHINDAIVELKA